MEESNVRSQKSNVQSNDRNRFNKRRRDRDTESYQNWTTVDFNKNFNLFYKAQYITRDEEDFERFLTCLKDPLPACFRLNSDYPFLDELKNELLNHFNKSMEFNETIKKKIQALHWCKNAYKMGVDKRQIKKLESLKSFHLWMMAHTDNGNITRQEAVSMVPPLALDILPHHVCLDMCAAPGSKTSQMMEVIHRSLRHSPQNQGFVVANDSDTKRSYLLTHQCRRLNSPFLFIATHNGQQFPSFSDEKVDGFFDRVLCDVPCSGDGTLRKNPMIWNKWATRDGISLHPLQLMIAKRGLRLLKNDNLMVYSTCSLSPYENEAVVAELLRHQKGTLELIDGRTFIPGFTARPGLSTWSVLMDNKISKKKMRNDGVDNKSTEQTDEPKLQNLYNTADPNIRNCIDAGFTYFLSHDDVPETQTQIRKSLFPPTNEERRWMHLERCLRCLPQDEDTGGFFVATFRKIGYPIFSSRDFVVKEQIAQDNTTDIAGRNKIDNEDQSSVNTNKNNKPEDNRSGNNKTNFDTKNKGNSQVEYYEWNEEQFYKMKEFYGFTDDLTVHNFFVREDTMVNKNNKEKDKDLKKFPKTIFFLPSKMGKFINYSINNNNGLKLVSAGTKAFERFDLKDGQREYRLVQDGIYSLIPFITKRKFNVKIQDFCNVLVGGLCSISTFSPETAQALSLLSNGVVIIVYTFSFDDVLKQDIVSSVISSESNDSSLTNYEFYAICWKGGGSSLNCCIKKVDLELIEHQLAALKVLRSKIFSEKKAIN